MTDKLAILGGEPLLDEAAHRWWPAIGDDEKQAVLRVLERGVLSGGNAPEAVAFEQEFADFVGAKYALLTHSGTSALQVALAAADVGPGDEVIVPAYSFIATALSVLSVGAIPRFVDIQMDTGNLNPDLLPTALSNRTKAVMPVHIHGCPADMDRIHEFARTHSLVVLEDAAQAHGATYQGASCGTLGSGAGFSLQSSKNLSAGEGGIYVTSDPKMIEAADQIRNFGQDLLWNERGYNPDRPLDSGRPLVSARMGMMLRGNEMMAAFGRVQLAALRDRTEAAQRNAAALCERLGQLEGVYAPHVPDGCTSVFHKFRVRFDPTEAGLELAPRDLRDRLRRALNAEGVNAVLWQDHSMAEHPIFQDFVGLGDGWPFRLADRPEEIRSSYSGAHYPVARALLDTSIVLFSQTRPLIGQSAETVEKYADAFEKVWAARHQLTEIAPS